MIWALYKKGSNTFNERNIMVANILVLPLNNKDAKWAKELWERNWSDDIVVSRGKIHHIQDLSGLIARISNGDAEPIGLLTYTLSDNQLEIVTLDSIMEGVGIGTALINECIQIAKKNHCDRVWLVTTNDNTEALRFYQRRGFAIHMVHKEAISESRKLKPKIPHIGNHGIPIRDEIELEYVLSPPSD